MAATEEREEEEEEEEREEEVEEEEEEEEVQKEEEREQEKETGGKGASSSSSDNDAKAKAGAAVDDAKKSALGMLTQADGKIAEKIKEFLPKLLVLGSQLETAIDKGSELYNKGDALFHKYYDQVEKYHPELILEIITGLVLMFFGGFFTTIISAVEAFRQGGAPRVAKHARRLREQMRKVLDENEKDNAVDADNDGTADVLDLSKEELMHRKFILVMRVADPVAVSSALSALYSAFIAVIASLQVKFARTLSLGAAIGEKLYNPVDHFVLPILRDLTSDALHNWYPIVFGYICQAVGVLIAFQIQRILKTVHTAVRGGNLLIEATEEYSQKIGYGFLTAGKIDDLLVWVMVALGIYFQLFVFTYLPFLLKVLLFPVFITEWLLQTLVATVDTD